MEAIAWTILAAVIIAAWAVLLLVSHHSRTQAANRAREMLHRERLAAIERGLPPPELTGDEWESAAPLIDDSTAALLRRALPRFFLAVGLLSVFIGLGAIAAFGMAPDEELRKIWSVGLLPLLFGVGCLLYFLLTRRHTT